MLNFEHFFKLSHEKFRDSCSQYWKYINTILFVEVLYYFQLSELYLIKSGRINSKLVLI